MNRFVRFAAIVLFLTTASVSCSVGFAQITSGQISGRVADPDGRVIPRAQVLLVNRQNAGERSATTDNQGDFVFASVQPGTYDLTVSAPGLKGFTKHDIVVNASDQLSAGLFQMQIGAAAQIVNVQA